jgi:hypothetical protein
VLSISVGDLEDVTMTFQGPDGEHTLKNLAHPWQGVYGRALAHKDFKEEEPQSPLTGPLSEQGFRYIHAVAPRRVTTGIVKTEPLKPGRYQVTLIKPCTVPMGVYLIAWVCQNTKPVDLAFDIDAGRSTYIGGYRFLLLVGKNSPTGGPNVGWNIVVTDKHERDLAFAAKSASVDDPKIEVPNVDEWNLLGFATSP